MKKAAPLAYLMLAAIAFLAINTKFVHSRMIGTNPTGSSADQWCVGGRVVGNSAKATTEVCVDSSGNVIPTTTNTGALGTTTLQWADTESLLYNKNGTAATFGGGSGNVPLLTFVPNLSTNTASAVINATIAQTTLVNCVAGSTITLTTPPNGGIIAVDFVGTSSVSVQGSTITIGVLVNGQFVDGETNAIGLVSVGNGAGIGGNNLDVAFYDILTGQGASTTLNICLTAASTSGTISFSSIGNAVVKLKAVALP